MSIPLLLGTAIVPFIISVLSLYIGNASSASLKVLGATISLIISLFL